MTKKKLNAINIFAGIDMSEEGIEKRNRENYKAACENPENMSYWLPKIEASETRSDSTLKIPQTKIIPLDYEEWIWLRSDQYTEEAKSNFNDSLVKKIGDFQQGKTKFMKSGIFSNKFEFPQTVVKHTENVGNQFLSMFYTSMVYGADKTAEVVMREMIEDQEARQVIYEGMPLHTEYRVFYDFDAKEVVGVANYWHPDVMTESLKDENALIYDSAKELLVTEYNDHKNHVAAEVAQFMQGCEGLHGKWSVDVMKNGSDFWLIDMARMQFSALVKQMERVG